MNEALLTQLSNASGFSNPLDLLTTLHNLLDETPPEEHKALVKEMFTLTLAFPELSDESLTSYIDLLYRIFHLSDITQAFTSALLLLRNLTFTFCNSLKEEEFFRLRKVLRKVYVFTGENFSEYLEGKLVPEEYALLLFKSACFLVAYIGNHCPDKTFPKSYIPCLIAVMKTNRIRESGLNYMINEEVTIEEWLAFFTILCKLIRRMKAENAIISDYIANLLYNFFKVFLSKILHKKYKEFLHEKFIKWANTIIISIAIIIKNIEPKIEELAKKLNKHYLRYDSKKFKELVEIQIMRNKELELIKRLVFEKEKEQKSQEVSNNNSLSKVLKDVKSKNISIPNIEEEIKFSSKDDNIFNPISDYEEFNDRLINDTNENINELDETLLAIHNQLNAADNKKLSYNNSTICFEEEERKLTKVNNEIENCIKNNKSIELNKLDMEYFKNVFEPFVLEYIEKNNEEMKERLKPFYDHFLHNLKVKLDRVHHIKFGIATWSNCSETYFVGGEELCVSVYSYYDYHPVLYCL